MSNQRSIEKLIKALSGQANILTIPRLYLFLTKSHRAALLLSQCVYWSDRTKNPEGWFYKTYAEWKKELALNQHAVETALKVLPWIETKIDRVNRTNKMHYRVRMEELTKALIDLAETANSDLAETANSDLAENYKSSIAEINNPEITNKPAPKARGRERPEDRALELLFCELTGLSPENCDPRSRSTRWWQPLQRIRKMANGRGEELIRAVVEIMRHDRLSISAPQSIEKIAQAEWGKRRQNDAHQMTPAEIADFQKWQAEHAQSR